MWLKGVCHKAPLSWTKRWLKGVGLKVVVHPVILAYLFFRHIKRPVISKQHREGGVRCFDVFHNMTLEDLA